MKWKITLQLQNMGSVPNQGNYSCLNDKFLHDGSIICFLDFLCVVSYFQDCGKHEHEVCGVRDVIPVAYN